MLYRTRKNHTEVRTWISLRVLLENTQESLKWGPESLWESCTPGSLLSVLRPHNAIHRPLRLLWYRHCICTSQTKSLLTDCSKLTVLLSPLPRQPRYNYNYSKNLYSATYSVGRQRITYAALKRNVLRCRLNVTFNSAECLLLICFYLSHIVTTVTKLSSKKPGNFPW